MAGLVVFGCVLDVYWWIWEVFEVGVRKGEPKTWVRRRRGGEEGKDGLKKGLGG